LAARACATRRMMLAAMALPHRPEIRLNTSALHDAHR
jgi:hypothetical protein